MQIKKDEVKEKILTAAKAEFLEKGFEQASLRSIAARVGATKGNIYTYFRNKNELFCELVSPVMVFLGEMMMQEYDDDYVRAQGAADGESLEQSIEEFTQFVKGVKKYKDAMKLLLFCSAGSEYENYREEIFRRYSESSRAFFQRWLTLNPEYHVQIPEMLLHSLASMYLSFIEELIVHEPEPAELKAYTKQMATFVHFGLAKILRS